MLKNIEHRRTITTEFIPILLFFLGQPDDMTITESSFNTVFKKEKKIIIIIGFICINSTHCYLKTYFFWFTSVNSYISKTVTHFKKIIF